MTEASLHIPETDMVLPRAGRDYLLRMSSLVLVDLGITGIFILVSGRQNMLLTDLVLNLAIFGALNMAGALLLLRAVFRHRGNYAAMGQMLNRLPALSAVWIAMLTLVYAGFAFSQDVFLPHDISLDSLPEWQRLLVPVWYGLVYVALYAIYTRFMIEDFCQNLKLRWFQQDIALPAAEGHFTNRLVLTMGFAAFAPVMLLLMDITVFQDFRALQGLDLTGVILLDVLTSSFLVLITLFFVVRSVSRPLSQLNRSIGEFRNDNLSVRAPVLVRDELGALAGNFNDLVAKERERRQIRDTMGQYIPEAVAATLLDNQGKLPPAAGEATILFADIADFTTLTDTYPADQMMAMLNECFQALLEPIEARRGTVTQFQGDALLTSFNLPIPDDNHACHAIEAALDMLDIVKTRRFADIAIDLRIGIATGAILSGSVGGRCRRNFSVYGNAVNLAARLEGLNKVTGTNILLSDDTWKLLPPIFDCRSTGDHMIKGFDQPKTLYTVARKPS